MVENSLRKIKAVLFDMDGVLIDSEPYHPDIEIETMKYFGITLEKKDITRYRGTTFAYEFADLIERYDLKVSLPEILQKHAQLAQRYYGEFFVAMNYAFEVLQSLKEKKYRLALVTGSPSELAKSALKRLALLDFFDVKIFAEDVKKGKPDPQPYLLAAKRLGVTSEEAAVVEDAINGFKSAKAAGMFVIGYQNSSNLNQDFSLADKVITDLREIFSNLS